MTEKLTNEGGFDTAIIKYFDGKIDSWRSERFAITLAESKTDKARRDRAWILENRPNLTEYLNVVETDLKNWTSAVSNAHDGSWDLMKIVIIESAISNAQSGKRELSRALGCLAASLPNPKNEEK